MGGWNVLRESRSQEQAKHTGEHLLIFNFCTHNNTWCDCCLLWCVWEGQRTKKKQGRAVKSCTTLSCLENGVQKYKVVLIAFYFFRVCNLQFGFEIHLWEPGEEEEPYLCFAPCRSLFVSCLPLLEVSDPPTNQYL